eukprot:1159803-Pelagomonas_calceolata.AAC.6
MNRRGLNKQGLRYMGLADKTQRPCVTDGMNKRGILCCVLNLAEADLSGCKDAHQKEEDLGCCHSRDVMSWTQHRLKPKVPGCVSMQTITQGNLNSSALPPGEAESGFFDPMCLLFLD